MSQSHLSFLDLDGLIGGLVALEPDCAALVAHEPLLALQHKNRPMKKMYDKNQIPIENVAIHLTILNISILYYKKGYLCRQYQIIPN